MLGSAFGRVQNSSKKAFFPDGQQARYLDFCKSNSTYVSFGLINTNGAGCSQNAKRCSLLSSAAVCSPI